MSNVVSDLKGDICIIFDALKKLEDDEKTKELRKEPNLKLLRQYKKLEAAFQDLSLDLDWTQFQNNYL